MADYYGFTFYSKDFVTSVNVVAMSLAARGAYITLLAYQSISDDCSLPDDDKKLAKLCGCSIEEWLVIKEELTETFTAENGRIYNERMREEREKIDSKIAQNVAAGKASAEKRAQKATGVEPPLNGRSTDVAAGVQPSSTQYTQDKKQEEEKSAQIAPSTSEEEEKDPKNRLVSKTLIDSSNKSILNAKNPGDSKAKPKNETLTEEVRTTRSEIKQFLAHKCFHAANEAETAMLLAKQVIQLNVAAAALEQKGATVTDIENWWKWFVAGGDWRCKDYNAAAEAGKKVNTPPSIINETWLAFTKNKTASNASRVNPVTGREHK